MLADIPIHGFSSRRTNVLNITNQTSNSPPWRIRPYRSGDEHQIVQLFQECFRHPIAESHWLWKLRIGTSQFENVWLAEAGNRIVGHFGGIPVRIWLNGHEVQAMVAVDSMVHPDFQGRWMFVSLVRHARQAWAKSGISFWFGLPNQNSGPAHKRRFGFQEVFPFVWKVRPLQIEPLLAARLQLPFLNSFTVLSKAWNHLFDRKKLIDKVISSITQLAGFQPHLQEKMGLIRFCCPPFR